MYCAQLTTIAWWILFALPQGKRMKFYGYGSILRPVFDCLRVRRQQLFCPQRRCRTFCLGRVPEYTPCGKKPCALLRTKWAYSIRPRKQQQPHRCACAAFKERKKKPKVLSKFAVLVCLRFTIPDRKRMGAGAAAPEKKFMCLPGALLRAIKALYYTFFRSCCTLCKMVSAIKTLFFRGGHAAFETQHATHGCPAQPL